MIKHIVIWKVKDHFEGYSKEVLINEMKVRLEALPSQLNMITSLEVGINMNASAFSGDVVLFSTFESLEALKAYQEAPEHQSVVSYIQNVVSDRIVVDYECDK